MAASEFFESGTRFSRLRQMVDENTGDYTDTLYLVGTSLKLVKRRQTPPDMDAAETVCLYDGGVPLLNFGKNSNATFMNFGNDPNFDEINLNW